MREYQQKNKIRTFLYSKVVIVFLFVAALLLLRSIMELNDKRVEMKKLRDESQKERLDLENKVKIAENKNSFIETDRGFENYVRTTFPVVKEGEGVIVVYENEKNLVSEVRESMTIWEKFTIYWNRLFKRQ